jgi:hypothetical protein
VQSLSKNAIIIGLVMIEYLLEVECCSKEDCIYWLLEEVLYFSHHFNSQCFADYCIKHYKFELNLINRNLLL